MTQVAIGLSQIAESVEVNRNKWRFYDVVLEPLVDSDERQRQRCKSAAVGHFRSILLGAQQISK